VREKVIINYFTCKRQQFIRLCPVSESSTNLRAAAFRYRDFDLGSMTLKLNRDIDILKMYLRTEHEIAR